VDIFKHTAKIIRKLNEECIHVTITVICYNLSAIQISLSLDLIFFTLVHVLSGYIQTHCQNNKKIKRADQILPEVYGTTLSLSFLVLHSTYIFACYFIHQDMLSINSLAA
jgi:hypothetical protein